MSHTLFLQAILDRRVELRVCNSENRLIYSVFRLTILLSQPQYSNNNNNNNSNNSNNNSNNYCHHNNHNNKIQQWLGHLLLLNTFNIIVFMISIYLKPQVPYNPPPGTPVPGIPRVR